MLDPSVDIFIKNISINFGIQKSVFDLEIGHPESAGRVVFGVIYNLRQSSYIANKVFKKKAD